MTRTLHVVTHATWVATDLAAAAPSDVTVRHSLGLDLPDIEPGDAIWAPMEWMARARHALGDTALLLLADPGPYFLTRLPSILLGRDVGCATLHAVADGAAPEHAYFKPANAKVDAVPAAWRSRPDFVLRAFGAGLPFESLVLFADRRLTIAEEHRVFVHHARAVTASPYLLHGTAGEEIWHEDMTSIHTGAALAFTQRLLDDLTPRLEFPPALVIDVALLADGTWVVLEANPVWSSAQYGTDLSEVIKCLFTANDPDAARGWEWDPDPLLVERSATKRVLR